MGYIDAYLIDAQSVAGLSGAPVFVNFGIVRIQNGQLMQSSQTEGKVFLLGLMHGHFKADINIPGLGGRDAKKLELVNFGISIVVPCEKILEVIEQPAIMQKIKKISDDMPDDDLPSMDTLNADEEVFTAPTFMDALRKASQKVSEPDQETK